MNTASKLKRIGITGLLLVFFSLVYYSHYRMESMKKKVVQELETFKQQKGHYPASLKHVTYDQFVELSYIPDSLLQQFVLSYTSGFMSIKTCSYHSEDKLWEEHFNY